MDKIINDIAKKDFDEAQLAETIFQRGLNIRTLRKVKFYSSDFYKGVKNKMESEEDFKKIKPLLKQCGLQKIKDGTIPKEHLVRTKTYDR